MKRNTYNGNLAAEMVLDFPRFDSIGRILRYHLEKVWRLISSAGGTSECILTFNTHDEGCTIKMSDVSVWVFTRSDEKRKQTNKIL
jgi:hypothetical protein